MSRDVYFFRDRSLLLQNRAIPIHFSKTFGMLHGLYLLRITFHQNAFEPSSFYNDSRADSACVSIDNNDGCVTLADYRQWYKHFRTYITSCSKRKRPSGCNRAVEFDCSQPDQINHNN